MKKLIAVVALILSAAPALALQQNQVPAKFGIPWGNSAGSAYIRSIPIPSQIGIQNCAASLTDGFPPLTFVPAVAGGCPPIGSDFNGILKQLSQWNQWQAAGGPVFYDGAFATASGGYPAGAMLQSAVTPGTIWLSTADSNVNNPDAAGAGWVQAPGQIPIGTPVQSLTATVPSGYVSANGKTIGNASSNGTGRANADTQFLFAFLWAGCPNSQCQLFNSGGTPISRGVSAAADFAANNAIATINLNGTGLIGADSQNGSTSSNLTGVPVTSGSLTAPGSIIGQNLHQLTVGELATHNHGVTDPGHIHTFPNGGIAQAGNDEGGVVGMSNNFFGGSGVPYNTNNAATGITINNTGSNTPHNTVERSAVVYWNLKL